MDFLDAINEVTSTIGTIPTNTTTVKHPAVTKAIAKLNTVRKRFQTIGYWFNRVKDVTYIRDINDNISVPPNVIDLEMDTNYVLRDKRVYDIVNKTFTLTENLELDTIYDIAFEDLPEVVAHAITAQAAVEFFSVEDGTTSQLNDLKAVAFRTFVRMKNVDLRHRLTTSHSQTLASKLLRGNPRY